MKLIKNLNYIALSVFLFISSATYAQKTIVIINTNDTHSRIEPIPANDKFEANDGGVVRRLACIEQIRKENKQTLLFDAGDFVQGTPYFNLFKGRVETKAMDMMKYNAGTLGNHEFDYGLDTLKRIVSELNYPLVNCNYDFSNTVLKGLIKPYIIIHKFGLKIGVLGVGVDPEGMIQKEKYGNMVFHPIIESANKIAKILKEQEKCDLIICLSHIGYESNGNAASDVRMAEQTRYIDLIIGGHSHTLMKAPDTRKNLDNRDVLIYQVGKNGAYLGEITVTLNKKNK